MLDADSSFRLHMLAHGMSSQQERHDQIGEETVGLCVGVICGLHSTGTRVNSRPYQGRVGLLPAASCREHALPEVSRCPLINDEDSLGIEPLYALDIGAITSLETVKENRDQ